MMSLIRFQILIAACATLLLPTQYSHAGDPSCYPLNQISSTPVTDSAYNLVYLDHYVILGNEDVDIMVFDVSDPASPQLVNRIPASGRVFLDGTILYATLTNMPGGVMVFDVADPENEVFLSEISPSESSGVIGIEFANGLVYMVDYQDGDFLIYDMSVPTSPVLMSSTTLPLSSPRAVSVRGTDVYIGGGHSAGVGLRIFDASNPSFPVLVGSLPSTLVSWVQSIQFHGDTAFIADEYRGVATVDVSDTANPVVLQSGFLGGHLDYAYHVEVINEVAFVNTMHLSITPKGDEFYGYFSVVDISDPGAPEMIRTINLDSFAYPNSMEIDSGLAFVLGREDLMVYDVSYHCDQGCPADMNGDESLNFLDVSEFLSAYGAGDLAADFSEDGQFNFLDVSAFLAAFGAGCP